MWISRARPALFGLAAEVADVDRQVLRVGAEVVVPDPVVDRGVIEHDPGVADQQFEQIELGLAEFDVAPGAADPTAGRVEFEVVEGQQLADVGLGAFERPGPVVLRSAQERPHPSEQLLEVERLGQVVVGSGIEPGDSIARFGAGRQHQHRHLVVFGRAARGTR